MRVALETLAERHAKDRHAALSFMDEYDAGVAALREERGLRPWLPKRGERVELEWIPRRQHLRTPDEEARASGLEAAHAAMVVWFLAQRGLMMPLGDPSFSAPAPEQFDADELRRLVRAAHDQAMTVVMRVFRR